MTWKGYHIELSASRRGERRKKKKKKRGKKDKITEKKNNPTKVWYNYHKINKTHKQQQQQQKDRVPYASIFLRVTKTLLRAITTKGFLLQEKKQNIVWSVSTEEDSLVNKLDT